MRSVCFCAETGPALTTSTAAAASSKLVILSNIAPYLSAVITRSQSARRVFDHRLQVLEHLASVEPLLLGLLLASRWSRTAASAASAPAPQARGLGSSDPAPWHRFAPARRRRPMPCRK